MRRRLLTLAAPVFPLGSRPMPVNSAAAAIRQMTSRPEEHPPVRTNVLDGGGLTQYGLAPSGGRPTQSGRESRFGLLHPARTERWRGCGEPIETWSGSSGNGVCR